MGDVIIYGTHGFASEAQGIIEDISAGGAELKCTGFMTRSLGEDVRMSKTTELPEGSMAAVDCLDHAFPIF